MYFPTFEMKVNSKVFFIEKEYSYLLCSLINFSEKKTSSHGVISYVDANCKVKPEVGLFAEC